MTAESPRPLTDAVIECIAAKSPRFRAVMSIMLRHLHSAIVEARLTEDEWKAAIDFLTATGQKCDANRQEFILLSDVLGVSMLVDEINHEAVGDVTDSTVFGPFYSGLQPLSVPGSSILKQDEPGEPIVMSGLVTDAERNPIVGALVEVWQTSSNGLYDVQDDAQPVGHLRGSFITDDAGQYRFSTVLPVSYAIPTDGPVGDLLHLMGRHPNRPAHTHFMISAPGHRRLVTHLFLARDQWLESDAVFGVKPSLVVEPVLDLQGQFHIHYNFSLAAAAPSIDASGG